MKKSETLRRRSVRKKKIKKRDFKMPQVRCYESKEMILHAIDNSLESLPKVKLNKLPTPNLLMAEVLNDFPIMFTENPTYNPETMIPTMFSLARLGKSFGYIACFFGTNVNNILYNWPSKHIEWAEAVEKTKTIMETIWEELGSLALSKSFFNNKMYEMQTSHRFNWKTKDDVKVGVQVNIDEKRKKTTDLTKLSLQQLKDLKQILEVSKPKEIQVIDV